MRDDVESDSLGQRTALSDRDDVTLVDGEGRGAMCRDVLVPLLEPTVLADVVEVVPADDDGTLHLTGRDDLSLQDTATDGDVSSEGALLVYVWVLDGGIGCLDAKADVLNEPHRLNLGGGTDLTLPCDEDSILLLVGLLVLVALDIFLGDTDHVSFLCLLLLLMLMLMLMLFVMMIMIMMTH